MQPNCRTKDLSGVRGIGGMNETRCNRRRNLFIADTH